MIGYYGEEFLSDLIRFVKNFQIEESKKESIFLKQKKYIIDSVEIGFKPDENGNYLFDNKSFWEQIYEVISFYYDVRFQDIIYEALICSSLSNKKGIHSFENNLMSIFIEEVEKHPEGKKLQLKLEKKLNDEYYQNQEEFDNPDVMFNDEIKEELENYQFTGYQNNKWSDKASIFFLHCLNKKHDYDILHFENSFLKSSVLVTKNKEFFPAIKDILKTNLLSNSLTQQKLLLKIYQDRNNLTYLTPLRNRMLNDLPELMEVLYLSHKESGDFIDKILFDKIFIDHLNYSDLENYITNTKEEFPDVFEIFIDFAADFLIENMNFRNGYYSLLY